MSRKLALLGDLGEGFGPYRVGDDDQLLDTLTAANVACGFHAGDPRTMQRTVASCLDRGVDVGAHPGFADLVGFGRRTLDMSTAEVYTDVLYQIGALHAFTTAAGASLTHVSPHGRLGNLVVLDERYATGVLDAVEAFDPGLVVVTQAGVLEQLARDRGMRVCLMAFPDRAYEPDGTLVSRREPDAVYHDPDVIAARSVTIATTGTIATRDGTHVHLECDSLLLHGDNPASVEAAHRVRAALTAAGVRIAAMSEVLDVAVPRP